MAVSTVAAHTIELHGLAMGSRSHIVLVDSPSGLLEHLSAELTSLEARWSRFIDSSEITRLNRQPDTWHLVSPETALLVERARHGWAATSGAFDPTVLPAVTAHGYRDSFDALPSHLIAHDARPPIGCAGIDVDVETGLVRLGPGAAFDPGGLGKGLAADLLVADAISKGAGGAMVNLGGDLACAGTPPGSAGWTVSVREPSVAPGEIASLALTRGAVATSTTNKRRWTTHDGERHHLVEPATGATTSGTALVTVVAAAAWWAEIVAKHLIVCGHDADIDTALAAAIVIDDDGRLHEVGEIARYRT